MDGRKLRRRPCAICGTDFRPDPRVRGRQRTCCAPDCQAEWRSRTQAKWRGRNPLYWGLPRAMRRREDARQEGERLIRRSCPPSLRPSREHSPSGEVRPGEILMLWLELDLVEHSTQDSMIARTRPRSESETDLRDLSTQDSMIARSVTTSGSEADLPDRSMQDPISVAVRQQEDPP